jgi:glycosyltransferase involved in cell wall biosynthesis
MKIGVIFFHRNIKNIYQERWIKKCVDSILNQTHSDFSIYEINYGGETDSVLEGFIFSNPHTFISEKKINHAEAMNSIIDVALEDGCDYIFNTNLDDFYDLRRFEVQISMLKSGFDLVSSDFCYIEEIEGKDEVTFTKNIKGFGDIQENLGKGHNVIAHPSVAYSRRFWEQNRYVPEEIPKEDMLLWIRSIQNGFKFYICDEVLLNYRLHENQVTGSNSYLAAQRKKEEEKNINHSSFINPTLLR